MATWLKTLLETLFTWWLTHQQRRAIHRAKTEGVKAYLKVLQGVRLSAMGVIGLLTALQLLSFGLALMIGAAIFLAPLEIETKIWAVFGIGALFFCLPALAMMVIFSERLWYRASGADALVKDVLKDQA